MSKHPTSHLDSEDAEMAHFFVYGTLKRGQFRERCWPEKPELVRSAWARGNLYDLGAYPAMTAGDTPIIGELWSFLSHEEKAVIRVLDEIEGTNQPGEPNLYDRVRLTVRTIETSEEFVANAYLYSDLSALRAYQPMQPAILDERTQIHYASWSFDFRSE